MEFKNGWLFFREGGIRHEFAVRASDVSFIRKTTSGENDELVECVAMLGNGREKSLTKEEYDWIVDNLNLLG